MSAPSPLVLCQSSPLFSLSLCSGADGPWRGKSHNHAESVPLQIYKLLASVGLPVLLGHLLKTSTWLPLTFFSVAAADLCSLYPTTIPASLSAYGPAEARQRTQGPSIGGDLSHVHFLFFSMCLSFHLYLSLPLWFYLKEFLLITEVNFSISNCWCLCFLFFFFPLLSIFSLSPSSLPFLAFLPYVQVCPYYLSFTFFPFLSTLLSF